MMNSAKQLSNETTKRRATMGSAGWVFAVENLPGVYVPGPQLRRERGPLTWLVAQNTILELLEKYSDDPEILAMFGGSQR